MDRPPEAASEDAVTGEVVAGRYRLDRSLGVSRMAEVYVATDLVLRRSVALKRLPSTGTVDGAALARFAREARALARVNDPNVVMVFDSVEHDGHPFLVMELVDGTTLRHLLDREHRLDRDRAVSIASGICAGLTALHMRGIVHRDLKPSNVFLTPSGTVKIGDLGISRVASDVTITGTGEVFGSAPYLAPEQITGGPVDARADLYALGCVLFEMLTGRPPFVGGDPTSLAYRHVHEQPERAEAVDPSVPPALASVAEHLMAKSPDDRPQTADEVARTLAGLPSAAAAVDAPTAPMERSTPTDVLPVPLPTDVLEVVATDVLPMAATDALPTSPPADALPAPPRAPDRPGSAWLPWVAGLILGIAALLLLDTVLFGADREGSAETGAGPRSSASAAPSRSVSPSPQSPTPTAPPVGTDSVLGAAAALGDLIRELEGTGAVDDHLARDLEHGLDAVARELDHGDTGEALEGLDELSSKVDEGLEEGKIGSEDAQRLQDAIGALGSALENSDRGTGDEEGD